MPIPEDQITTASWEARDKTLHIVDLILAKHAEEVVVLEIGGLTSLTDFFVICSADSRPQVQAIVDAVKTALSEFGIHPVGIEGCESGIWVLMDYNDVILHIFRSEAREFYNLDRLWGDAPEISITQLRVKAHRRGSVKGLNR